MTRGWDIGVGATSVLAVQVARDLYDDGLPVRVIASRNQCPGYAFHTREELIEAAQPMPVIRDHGGPLQGLMPDVGILELKRDVLAGFNALHIDVCKLPDDEQLDVLRMMVRQLRDNFKPWPTIEVGDERDIVGQSNLALAVKTQADGVVAPAGTHCFELRQIGTPDPDRVARFERAVPVDVDIIIHNADWAKADDLTRLHDAGATRVNVAPEIALAEIDAVLEELTSEEREDFLNYSLDAGRWKRWFPENVTYNSRYDRARAGAHYVLKECEDIVRDAYKSRRAYDRVKEAILRVA